MKKKLLNFTIKFALSFTPPKVDVVNTERKRVEEKEKVLGK